MENYQIITTKDGITDKVNLNAWTTEDVALVHAKGLRFEGLDIRLVKHSGLGVDTIWEYCGQTHEEHML